MRLKVDLPSTKCPVCGERKGRYRDHSLCSRKMQAAALNVNPPAPEPRPKMRITPPPPRQRGFSLVEIAVVLVIIAILLAGVTVGTPLINSSDAQNTARSIKAVEGALISYRGDRYALPGDDAGATARFGAGAVSGNGNRQIEGAWDATSGESFHVAQHLRYGKWMVGSTNPADPEYPIKTATGGIMGVTSQRPYSALTGFVFICADVRGSIAMQTAANLGSRNPTSGNVVIALPGSTEPVQPSEIDESALYVLCYGVQ